MGPEIIGKSKAAMEIRAFILKAARSDYPVLLCGETGVGKEVVASNIHHLSKRKSGPFMPVNCAGIPPYLIESELFGHRKGSFTDAKEDRTGLIEAAYGGTIFLDEIAESSLGLQAKLLRTIERQEVRRVGESFQRKVEVRFIFATNRKLEKEIKKGNFRLDFYFRINILKLDIPPLRERREDIPLFIENLIREANIELKENKRMSRAGLEKLLGYSFPGNIRELENILKRAFVLSGKKEIRPEDIVFESSQEEEEVVMRLYREMVSKGKSFWEVVHVPFLQRDLNRRQVKALLSFGLNETKGSYKKLLSLFHAGDSEKDYKKWIFSRLVEGNVYIYHA